jgi:hypothetical protein
MKLIVLALDIGQLIISNKSEELNMSNTTTKELIDLLITDKTYTYDIPLNNQEHTFILEITENMEYRRLMSIADKIANIVVDGLEYSPEMRKPILLFYILNDMSNVKPQVDEDGNMDIEYMFKLLKSPIGQKIFEDLIYDIPTLYQLNNIVDDKINHLKEQLLHSNSAVEILTVDLLQKEIEVQELQKKVLEQTDKINSQFSKEEIDKMTNVFADVSKMSQNPEYLKAVAEAIHKENKVKKPQDHKKTTTKTNKKNVDNVVNISDVVQK